MSLNKLTNIDELHPWMNINCKDIVCENITVTSGAGGIFKTSGGTIVNLDSTGLHTIMSLVVTTLQSISVGFDGQKIEVYAYDGGQLTVLDNMTSGNPTERVILTSLGASQNVIETARVVGYGVLIFDAGLNSWQFVSFTSLNEP